MKVLVCGGREYPFYGELSAVLDKLHEKHCFSILVHGDAGRYAQGGRKRPVAISGADALAGRWAEARGVQQVKVPANWNGQGDAAGSARNKLMLDLFDIDMIVGFPGGPGTANMMWLGYKNGIRVVDTEDL